MGVIYKITEKTTGKVYIGQTQNPSRRKAQYRYLTSHDDTYHSHERYFNTIIKNKDFDNDFTFDILEKDVNDQDELNRLEMQWISIYDSTNPEKGYNIEYGGGCIGKLPKSVSIRNSLKSTKKQSVYVYNIETEEIFMCMSCASAGVILNCNPEMVAMAARNATRLKHKKYFVFYTKYKLAHKYLDAYISDRHETLVKMSSRESDQNTNGKITAIHNYAVSVITAFNKCAKWGIDIEVCKESRKTIDADSSNFINQVSGFKAKPFKCTEYSRPLYLYDINTDKFIYYRGGPNEVADKFGYRTERVHYNARRGHILDNRYYVFYEDPSLHEKYGDPNKEHRNNYAEIYKKFRNHIKNLRW